jgi:hypothetical protein
VDYKGETNIFSIQISMILFRMTYCEIFTIGNADSLVMKKIGYWPITEADC